MTLLKKFFPQPFSYLLRAALFSSVLYAVSCAFADKLSLAQSFPILSPEAAWSGSYLVNSAFITEYALLWKDELPVDKSLMIQPAAVNLWKRAFFAQEAMRFRGQSSESQQKLREKIDQHYAMLLKVQPTLTAERDLIQLSAAIRVKPEEQSRADAGYQLIISSFNDEKHQANAKDLRSFYFADAPTCPITAAEVKDFVAYQAKLLSEKSAINGGVLITPLKDWPLKKVRCLIFALLATAGSEANAKGHDPVHLMLTFQQMASPLAKDAAFKGVYSIRLLQTNQFAETLRVLVELVDLQPAFRLPYEMVQRIFSMRQKGDGQVALKGI
jgi:hypothetical protein